MSAKELTEALLAKGDWLPLTTRLALNNLTSIFHNNFNKNKNEPPRVNKTDPPRVMDHGTADNDTQKENTTTPAFVHEHVTRANKPLTNKSVTVPSDENTAPHYNTNQPNFITQPDEPPTLLRRSPLQHSNSDLPFITQEINAVTLLMDNQYSHPPKKNCAYTPVCNAVVHPVTKETITKYNKLALDPITSKIWRRAFYLELGRMAQGYLHVKGTNTIRFLTLEQIRRIPTDPAVTYA